MLCQATESVFNTNGYHDWRRAFKGDSRHENGQEHRKWLLTYYRRVIVTVPVDMQLAIQFNRDSQYREEVLKEL